MSKGKKVGLMIGVLVVLAVVVIASISSNRKNTVLVQTSEVKRKDVLSSKVTASGSIRAKDFVDLQSEIAGIITELPVREGVSVKKGDFLLKIDPIQTTADKDTSHAQCESAMAESRAQEFLIMNAEANLLRDEASLRSSRADLEQAENNFSRAQSSFKRSKLFTKKG